MQLTTALGLLFLALQVYSWFDLAQHGVFMERNPQGSMFYVFTGLHGAHVVAGIGIFCWLLHRSRVLGDSDERALRRQRVSAGAAAWYWHFMGVLWVALFALLHLWA